MPRTESIDEVRREAKERLYPSLANPNYLALRQRRLIFKEWLTTLSGARLRVLDVGGRIQPYRPLIVGAVENYVAVDIQDSPLVNVQASVLSLPFPENTFDLVFCTQVLEYIAEPSQAVIEIHRVLKSDGMALFSIAAFLPAAVEEEHWRFTRTGARHLMTPFRDVQVVPEGSSISGFFRACAVCLCIFARFPALRAVVSHTVVPVLNLAALALEKIAGSSNVQAVGNYSIRTLK